MCPAREHRLTSEERKRNTWGTSTRFSYDPSGPTTYPSSLPGFFPTIQRCYCRMEPFDLPTLDGLHLIPGLCDGVFLGADALAGFPSLKTLSHTAVLDFHGVNVHGCESKNKSMIVKIENPPAGMRVEEVAKVMIGQKTFIGWPFLQEGLVVSVSDHLFKYEKMSIIPGSPPKVLSTPHAQQGLVLWERKAERIESLYSKKYGVLTGHIEMLLHVRPLKGLKRLETGALVKDYEEADKEIEQALQMCPTGVISEDPRFVEKEPPSLKEEFLEGSKVFFLGEHAYGVAAQVTDTSDISISVVLAVM